MTSADVGCLSGLLKLFTRDNLFGRAGKRIVLDLPRSTPWTGRNLPAELVCHVWIDESYSASAGLGWLITTTPGGSGDIIAQGTKTLGGSQTSLDAEVAAIDIVVQWFWTTGRARFLHMVVHLDSTSAILRTHHPGAGPGQNTARRVTNTVTGFIFAYRAVEVKWVKEHIRVPGNKRADALVGQAAEKGAWSPVVSLTFLNQQISDGYRARTPGWPGMTTLLTTARRQLLPKRAVCIV